MARAIPTCRKCERQHYNFTKCDEARAEAAAKAPVMIFRPRPDTVYYEHAPGVILRRRPQEARQ